MKRFFLSLAPVMALLLVSHAAMAAGNSVDFNRDIRPILSDNCFSCHGPDENTRKAKLRLDTREGAFADLGGYHAVKPGSLKESELWARVTTSNPDDLMPPAETGKKLKPEQIALLKQWIEQGAQWQEHWAFVPPVRQAPPQVKNPSWPRNGIDNFIAAKLDQKGLKNAPEASKEILIRRVTFDLTGLPPTPAEVDAFLKDKSPEAYDRLVDRLLKSPRYGEHMARYWLDAARYGDTHGLHLDNERSMWPYRDWVVSAFNDNLSFDKFTIWQIAGDLLPNATREQQIASGFNRCNVTTSEGGSINEEFLFRYAVDRTETMSAVFMGLTAGCAVCHDHKFDPISQKEFYQLYSFFYSAADPAMDGNILLTPPILKLTSPDQQRTLEEFDGKIKAVEKQIKERLAKVEYTDPAALDPAPPVKFVETVWVDDDFPADAKPQNNQGNHPLTWIGSDVGPVLSGKRALKRTDAGLAQDFFNGIAKPFDVPAKGKIFAHVYLDPANPPKAIMLQFHTTGWSHRAVWGDIDAIPYGKKGTVERLEIGPLPAAGEWARIELDVAALKLPKDAKINGLAFTQFGGTVYWDKVGTGYESNPVTDIRESQIAWEKENQGKSPQGLPREIQNIFRSVNPKDRKPEHNRQLRDYYLEFVYNGTREVFDPLHQQLDPLKKERDEFDKTIPATLIMKDLDKPRDAHVMIRGQYNKPGDRVSSGVPAFLPPLKAGETTNRLDLAHWLVDPAHPLTARVTVNRLWQQFFGTGLVKTPGDFGSQGQPPSHPELLDWLATTFVDNGWDVKRFVKMIVTSATYRQDSKATPELLEADPENLLLARGPRFRLDAETIRDNALFVSGLMDHTLGGKGVKPYQPENIWEPVGFGGSNTRFYKQDSGSALYRRSLYTFWKRTAPPPSMTTFDAPPRESFCVARERSNTPLQALLLMNDVQFFEAARALGQRMMLEGGDKTEERLAHGFRLVTARKPSAAEKGILKESFEQQLARYRQDAEAAKQAIQFGESKPDPALDPSELAAFTMVANVLLNMDETLNKN